MQIVEVYKGCTIKYDGCHFIVDDILSYNKSCHQHLFDYSFFFLTQARSAVTRFLNKTGANVGNRSYCLSCVSLPLEGLTVSDLRHSNELQEVLDKIHFHATDSL